MTDFLGREYNIETWLPSVERLDLFRAFTHAGEVPPDFVLPTLDGDEVRLSALRGKPVMIEFGSIT